jgi:putative transcriptional regulator
MKREELIDEVRDTLTKAGFYVSELYSMRSIGFDLIARRDNSLLIIKILINIDAMSDSVANELMTLSNLLKGCPLLIGEKSGLSLMEDNVVYDRFGIQVVTMSTLKNHLLEGAPLEIYAGPGGFYVNLDKCKIKQIRQEQDLSIGSFARSIKVSRRTVQRYEEGMNATVDIALRIEDILGTNITLPIDIINKTIPKIELKNNQSQIQNDIFQDFQREIFSILKKVGYKVIPMERMPFEAVSHDKKEILLTCVDRYDKKLLKKAHVVSSISKIIEKHAVIIPDRNVEKKNIEGTPLIIKKELKKIRGPEELLELIIERLYSN